MKNRDEKNSILAILKYTGAFMAWVIGSGFASGQETLQFFSSYGLASYGVVLINFAGFILLGRIIVTYGYDYKNTEKLNHFTYFCGKKLGIIYSWLIPATLVLIMSVLLSGGGSALFEYYGINRHIGSALMAFFVLYTYLVGFEKMVRVVSMISPLLIIFTLFVGTVTVIRDIGGFAEVERHVSSFDTLKASPNWVLSSVLYLSLNFLSGSTYYTALGVKAESRRSVQLGALFGAIALIISIAIMNTAILLNAENSSSLAIPTLYLAKKISYSIGAAFSVILILGIFSSCAAMMWTISGKIFPADVRKNRIAAVVVAIGTFILSMFRFTRLVNVFYPFVGYMGLLFVGCVLYKGIKNQRRMKTVRQ